MLGEYWNNVQKKQPRVHVINNYVTALETANLLLACGAKPIMADAAEEVSEITAACSALCLNMGTLSPMRLEAMLIAGKMANQLSLPIVLDPVAVGASNFRMGAAKRLLDELQFTVIRCNASELIALTNQHADGTGVDAKAQVSTETLAYFSDIAQRLAQQTSALVVVTGSVDLIASQDDFAIVHNGVPLMSRLSGMGCQLSALCAAFLAANPKDCFGATLAAVASMGVCGELAHKGLSMNEGSGSFRNRFLDVFGHLASLDLDGKARYEYKG